MVKINCADLSVLVLDDNEVLRDVLRQNLLKMGFKDIDLVSTASDAQQKISGKPYDIVFVDWVMPGKSGFAMMQEYRQDRAFDHVAFIMVTNQSDERHMVEAMKAGATSYIFKSAEPAPFRAKVQDAIDWIAKVSPRFKTAR